MAASCRGDQSDTTSAWKERNGLHHAHVLRSAPKLRTENTCQAEVSRTPTTSPTQSSSCAGNEEETGGHQRLGEQDERRDKED